MCEFSFFFTNPRCQTDAPAFPLSLACLNVPTTLWTVSGFPNLKVFFYSLYVLPE